MLAEEQRASGAVSKRQLAQVRKKIGRKGGLAKVGSGTSAKKMVQKTKKLLAFAKKHGFPSRR